VAAHYPGHDIIFAGATPVSIFHSKRLPVISAGLR